MRQHRFNADEKRKLRNRQRRVDRARASLPVFPGAGARHLHSIADALAARQKYHMIDEEPEHVAESILMLLEHHWKMQRELHKLKAIHNAGVQVRHD